jgi:hypothetical protein
VVQLLAKILVPVPKFIERLFVYLFIATSLGSSFEFH